MPERCCTPSMVSVAGGGASNSGSALGVPAEVEVGESAGVWGALGLATGAPSQAVAAQTPATHRAMRAYLASGVCVDETDRTMMLLGSATFGLQGDRTDP